MATTKIVTRTRKEALELWADTLESGKYRQAQGQLRETTVDKSGHTRRSFCCLGVLCDLARKDGGPQWDQYDQYGMESGFLPKDIAKYTGVNRTIQNKLIKLNDDTGASFKKIAKYIRAEVIPKVTE